MLPLSPIERECSIPKSGFSRFCVLAAAHVAPAVAMRFESLLATGHAVLTWLAGLYCALSRGVAAPVYVCAYITGAEALWRMSRGAPAREFGKYACLLALAITMVRPGRTKPPIWPLALLGLPLPAMAMPPIEEGWAARQDISFNLSGHYPSPLPPPSSAAYASPRESSQHSASLWPCPPP